MALLAFYDKVLEPEFRSIEEKLSEHDEKFKQLFDRFDILHQRLEKLEKGFHSIAMRCHVVSRRLRKGLRHEDCRGQRLLRNHQVRGPKLVIFGRDHVIFRSRFAAVTRCSSRPGLSCE